MKAPGEGILKMVSILYIIFGGFFALMMILSLFLGTVLASWFEGFFGGFGALVGGLMFIVFLIPAVVDLIIGIVGAKRADDLGSANFFIVTGIVLTALTLIGIVFSFAAWGLAMFIMPVLYIVGGYMNKNAAAGFKG